MFTELPEVLLHRALRTMYPNGNLELRQWPASGLHDGEDSVLLSSLVLRTLHQFRC